MTGKDKEEVQTEALTDDNDGADEVTYEVSKAMEDEDALKVSDNVLTMLSGWTVKIPGSQQFEGHLAGFHKAGRSTTSQGQECDRALVRNLLVS